MAYEIVWEPHGVYKKFWGYVSSSEFSRSVAAVHNDPRFDSLRYSINDYLAVKGFDVAENTVDVIAAMSLGARTFHPKAKIALVTDNDRIVELARHYSSPPLGSYPTEIFATVESAREWVES